jgi:hypothetical protein
MNDGALWAGRGASSLASFGVRLAIGRLRAVIAPELIVTSNADWTVVDSTRFGVPGTPPERSGGGYAFPWYAGPYSIDIPTRFGANPIRRGSAGQSALYLTGGRFEVGVATENQWWGPGERNALILSNNAAGFPHVFARSARPWATPLGRVEWRWIVGGVEESDYFDTTTTNDLRSLSALGVTLQPGRSRNLTIGFARSVMGTATGWEEIPLRWLEVFHNTGYPNEVAFGDSALYPGGREQLMSLFARYVMPKVGAEVYGEWARTEMPHSLRDFLVAPNHTQGYTIGLGWSREAWRDDGILRVQGEITTVEQSATFRDRPLGIWYTSRGVIQGYTHRGQSLGAAIGPGSSAQWLAFDYFLSSWAAGIYGGRIRWNEDMRSLYGWPDFQQTCTHDVTLYWGARAERRWRRAFVAADLTLGNRINAFFQVGSGCGGNNIRDIRNNTLALTIGAL